MNEDAALLCRYVSEGSEEAFAELVQRHISLVYFAALRRLGGNARLAEEVTQQVFTLLALKARSLLSHSSLTGWLYTTTRNTALKLLRDEQLRRQREQEAQSMNTLMEDSARDEEWSRLKPVIDQALDELGDKDRQLVLQRFFEGRGFAEIGREFRLSEDAARMRVERALGRLQGLLAKRGITSTSAALMSVLAAQGLMAVPAGLVSSVSTAALAAAAAGSVAASTGIIAFMSTTKFITATALGAMALAVGGAGYEVLQAREARAALAGEQAEFDALSKKLAQAEAQPRVTGELQRSKSSGGTGATDEITKAFQVGDELMAAHPEIREMVTRYYGLSIAKKYRSFYKERGLSPEQIASFEILLMAGSQMGFHDVPGLGTVGLCPYPAGSPDEWTDKLKALLGEDGFKRMREYQSYMQQGATNVSNTAGLLYFSDSPLSKEQCAQLGQVIMEAKRASKPTESCWPAILDKAQAFLNPTQLAALQDVQAGDEVMRAMSVRAMQRGKSNPGK